MQINLSKITKKGKAIYLAYDQGLEHGPTDFNDKNIDPSYILEIARKGKVNGIVLQKGIAEKYYNKKKDVPLILKLNGKTKLVKKEPYAPQLCSVKEAIKLGAKAVGYTIYVGSAFENKMFVEFESIQREAHRKKLPVIAWVYPRGKSIKNELNKKVLAYAARIGLELGADIMKMKYNGKINDLKWIVKSAGKAKIVIAGGPKKGIRGFLKQTQDVVKAGAIGLAVGRNIWQYKEPLKMIKALKKVIFENKNSNYALKILK
jgi:class I fructose-bisphosphate aldolase